MREMEGGKKLNEANEGGRKRSKIIGIEVVGD